MPLCFSHLAIIANGQKKVPGMLLCLTLCGRNECVDDDLQPG